LAAVPTRPAARFCAPPSRRGLRLAAAALVAAAVLQVPVVTLAQTPAPPDTTGVPATVAPAATTAPTSAVPTTTIAATGTTVEECPVYDPPAVIFVGEVTARGDTLVTFRVDEVRIGTPPGSTADIEFPDDARFFRVGESYLVSASIDVESGVLSSKIRRPNDEDLPEACTSLDLVVTRNADGTKIDTGVFAGMEGKWGQALLLMAIPALVALGVLVALVVIKRVVVFGVKAPGRLRAWRRRRQARQGGRPAPPPGPPPGSRTRTRTDTPARP
jgi:hypothetical protein